MRSFVLVAFLLAPLFVTAPASAQLLVPFATPDGRIACTQGMTGIGRPPAWKIQADPDGPGGWVLAETAADPADLRLPFCINEQAVLRDLDATLRFKPVSGIRARVGGFIFRTQSANDYYVVRADALDNSVRLYRMEKGKRRQVGAKEVPVESGVWHSLRVIAVSDRFEVFLDGISLFSATDRTLIQAGPMGAWSQADSLTLYGSLLVNPPAR
ncbi:MAG: hypothetical protein Q8N31_08470 [Reyranella sp.]|nr:hypothetical protein [Reyranella sp.]MDP3160034.1 hypothetical protein [Reyranella sp.]